MAIELTPSSRSTLGIEWEVTIIDRDTRELTNLAPHLLQSLEATWPSDSFPHVTGELLQNTIEFVSAPHARVSDALGDLRTMATEANRLAHESGARIIGSGSHPFSRWDSQQVTPAERYERFIERTRWWGRNMLIWGVHVHLGVDRKERFIPLMHALLAYLPHMQALAASSPFWAGESTGYASNRTLMFQQLPTAGLPWDIDNWEEFERILADLTRTGIIAEPTEARWDVRPAPRWGTLELRACDGASTLWEIGALAAFSQSLIELFQQQLDAGEELPRLQPWYIRENKWRAARYGLEANIITAVDGTETPLREHLAATLAKLEPISQQLGCVSELSGAHDILRNGNSSMRQIARLAERSRAGTEGESNSVPRSALISVVDTLADEFQASLSA